MARKKKTKKRGAPVDPEFLRKQRAGLKRNHRKTVLFNAQELAAIDEYCTRFKFKSRSALIRQAVMQHVLSGLEKNHPTLF